ncbi:MAG: tol-pal system YbgF family protein [Maioricimonas sp. JB045]|uniref:tetratricopeptide repeat protein n=1 Tax=Maioricimonas sp. JC845 TaxID=3232138 RepID=UPI00345B3463
MSDCAVFRRAMAAVPALGLTLLICVDAPLEAQNPAGRRSRPSAASVRILDLEAKKAHDAYVQQMLDLANGYLEAGSTEKARDALESVLKVEPESPVAKEKLEEIRESAFESSVVVEVDAGRSWTAAGVVLTRDKPVRFEADGNYKFIVNTNLGPDGFDSDDPTRDLVRGIKCGAVMGMIVPTPQRGKKPRKPEPPFAIGSGNEITPKEGGTLFLKVNVPPGANCIGKIKVKISGNYRRG